MNLYSMLTDAIRRQSGQTAISCADRYLTYREFDHLTFAISEFLTSLGCERGDRVLLYLHNGFEYPAVLFAAIRAGMVVVPVNAKLHPREVAWICGDAEPRVVVTHHYQVEALHDALATETGPQIISVEDIPQTYANRNAAAVEVEPDDAAWIFYTSGTTGRPKGATLTHRNLIAAAVNCLADIFPFAASDRVLHVAPLSHGSGLYLLPSLMRGAHNIISDRRGFQPDEVLDIVTDWKVTVIAFLAPTMIVRLLQAKPKPRIYTLRGVIYGGAAIHLDHIRAAVRRFGPIFVQLYGQGEAPMTISYLPAGDHADADDDLLLSAGYVRAGVDVRIIDENGNQLEDGEAGEICVRGDVVMKEYWRNLSATASALQDGWLHTGDIGQFDAKGRLRLMDRRHDTIISGGANIYPKEVEDAIATHPAVREVVAFGLPDAEWVESVAVAIVMAPGVKELGCDDISTFCRESLASFKKPKKVFIVDALPQSAYGKVLRRELKERFSES